MKTEIAHQPIPSEQELDNADSLYIRFGNLPKGGRSKNHNNGCMEAGVSCYHARRIPGERYKLRGDKMPIAAIHYAFGNYGNVALLLRGKEVGVGSDGEPLLQDPEIVAHLAYSREEGYFFAKIEEGSKNSGRAELYLV